MKTFIILTTIKGITTEKEIQAKNFANLIENINKTHRGKMEYQVYSSKPFDFNTLLYTHHSESFYRE